MGQGDVINTLEDHGGWMTNDQIATALNKGESPVNRVLNILLRHGDIECKPDKTKFRGTTPYLYKAL